VARLDELERKFEENPRRYFAPLANEYRKAGDARRAAELCRSQLPEIPGHISGHIVLGQALFDAGDHSASREALETALALDPDNIVALRYLGDIAWATGEHAQAEVWYSRTIEADPYNEAAQAALESLRAVNAAGATLPDPDGDEEGAEADAEPLVEPPVEPAAYEPLVEAVADEPLVEALVDEQVVEAPAAEPLVEAPAAEPPGDDTGETAEFAGDLTVSAAPASGLPEPEPAVEESPLEPAVEATAEESAGDEAPEIVVEETSPEAASEEPSAEVVIEEPAPESVREEPSTEPAAVDRFDVDAHPEPGPAAAEDQLQAEERVMEAAAPFVTETMADLYLEQGYPHEALELLLQLSEQRPSDEELRHKVERIESIILARRDAAVAAARAERAEATVASEPAEAASGPGPEPEPEPEPAPAAAAFDGPLSVRDMFARMDRARPRVSQSTAPRPAPRLRSDFVPQEEEPVEIPSPLPRTSGPHPTFDPSTADIDDFNAWLRGLRGS